MGANASHQSLDFGKRGSSFKRSSSLRHPKSKDLGHSPPCRIDRLRRSFRDSFRKKKDCVSDANKPQLWQMDEMDVRSGSCFFHVKYLGCVEVYESRGMQVCEDALKSLKNSRRRPVKAILYISGDGLRVVEDDTKGLIVDQTIEKVSFCAPDRNHDKGFSYICRDGTTRRWMCHGFLAIKESGERLSHAVGCAFAVCLERKQKRDKECAVTMNFDPSNSTFTRTGSFKKPSLTDRLPDICTVKGDNTSNGDTTTTTSVLTTTTSSAATIGITTTVTTTTTTTTISTTLSTTTTSATTITDTANNINNSENTITNDGDKGAADGVISVIGNGAKTTQETDNIGISTNRSSASEGKPVTTKPPVRLHSIERPHASMSLLQRQCSFRGLSHLNHTSPFKRQLSLRLSELPSNLERMHPVNFKHNAKPPGEIVEVNEETEKTGEDPASVAPSMPVSEERLLVERLLSRDPANIGGSSNIHHLNMSSDDMLPHPEQWLGKVSKITLNNNLNFLSSFPRRKSALLSLHDNAYSLTTGEIYLKQSKWATKSTGQATTDTFVNTEKPNKASSVDSKKNPFLEDSNDIQSEIDRNSDTNNNDDNNNNNVELDVRNHEVNNNDNEHDNADSGNN